MSDYQNRIEEELDTYYHNPAAIQQVAIDMLDEANNGNINIVDPTNPFMTALECSATNTHVCFTRGESLVRRLYPKLAAVDSDLYHHMADVDYLERFAVPSRTVITLTMPVSEIQEQAVYDSTTELRRVVLPKDTGFEVSGYKWYLHRPINITLSNTGVIQVSYDMSYRTPLADSETNLLDYTIVTERGIGQLVIRIPVEQLSVESKITPVSPSTGYNDLLPYEDDFYFMRAYHRVGGGAWSEIAVTHSDRVYDQNKPTIVIKVLENTVQAQLPEIYMTRGLIGDAVRVDIFTTKGEVLADLADFAPSEFTNVWRDFDNRTPAFVAPLPLIQGMGIFAADPIVGGRKEISFEALRERVLYRSGDVRASITFQDLTFQLNDMGYSLTKAKDTVTERLYHCSRTLPPPTTTSIITPIGVKRGYCILDPERTDLGTAVIDNGFRKTLTTSTLFKENSGVIEVLGNSAVTGLTNQARENLVQSLNETAYLYTPFFYVLDPANDLYDVRPYHLDAPKELSRSYIEHNTTVYFAVNTRSITINRIGSTFTVTVLGETANGIGDLHAQLVYTDAGGQRYRMTADQVSIGLATFTMTFVVTTTLDITQENRIETTSFIGPSNGTESLFIELDSQFDLYYFKSDEGSSPSLFDAQIDFSGYSNAVGITHESIILQWGKPLTHLANRARAVIVPPVYRVNEEDVPELYTKRVYERDENDIPVYTKDPVTDEISFNIIHDIGDVVLDEFDQPKIKYPAGSLYRDAFGQPEMLTPERLIWEIEPVLLDARYYFATSNRSVNYRRSIPDTIAGYLERDIEGLLPTLLERTEVAFQPKGTMGLAHATNALGKALQIETALPFDVVYQLTTKAFNDDVAKATLVKATKDIIVNALGESSYSHTKLIKQLRNATPDYVKGMVINNPLGEEEALDLVDKSNVFSTRAVIRLLSNGALDVEDDVSVRFVEFKTTN